MTDQQDDLPNDVVAKAIRVLETLSHYPDGLPLNELAAQLGVAKSSLHRTLSTWVRLGYVEKSEEKVFRMGFRVMELAGRLQRGASVVERSRTVLTQLHKQFDESTYLGVYREGSVLLVDAIESTKPLRICIDLGEKCWLHAAAQGRSVAAYLSDDELAHQLSGDLPKVTANTNIDREALDATLAGIRANGYAINYEETVEGSVCFGAPFFAGKDGPVMGALGLAVPTPRASERIVKEICIALPRYADELSERLAGYPSEPGTLSRQQVINPPSAPARRSPAYN